MKKFLFVNLNVANIFEILKHYKNCKHSFQKIKILPNLTESSQKSIYLLYNIQAWRFEVKLEVFKMTRLFIFNWVTCFFLSMRVSY